MPFFPVRTFWHKLCRNRRIPAGFALFLAREWMDFVRGMGRGPKNAESFADSRRSVLDSQVLQAARPWVTALSNRSINVLILLTVRWFMHLAHKKASSLVDGRQLDTIQFYPSSRKTTDIVSSPSPSASIRWLYRTATMADRRSSATLM